MFKSLSILLFCSVLSLPSGNLFASPGVTDFGIFMRGAKSQSLEIAIICLESGTPNQYIGNPGIVNDLDKTPLIVFISEGDIELVRAALDAGADPNLPRIWRDSGETYYPTGWALQYGHAEIVRLLVERGADLSLFSFDDVLLDIITGMRCASDATRYTDCIKFALEHGADPHYVPWGDESCYEIAKKEMLFVFVQELLRGKYNRGRREFVELLSVFDPYL